MRKMFNSIYRNSTVSKLLKRTAAFLSGAALMFTSSALPYSGIIINAVEQTGQSQNNIEQLDPVTNLHWIEGSSATIAWNAVEEANYYSVTVDVYEEDGGTLIGSTGTGTTATELDVQQEINSIIGDTGYSSVKVKIIITAQKKQDDEIAAESYSAKSEEYTYYTEIRNDPILCVPSDLILENDGTIKFKYEGDRIEGIYHTWELKVANPKTVSGRYKSGIFYLNECSYEDGYYYTTLKDFEGLLFSCYKSLYTTNQCNSGDILQVSVIMNTGCNGHSGTSYSQRSNYIEYSSTEIFSKLYVPSDLILENDGTIKFKYEGDPIDGIYHAWELKVANPKTVNGRYKSGNFYLNECSYEDGYYYTTLKDFEGLLFSCYKSLYTTNQCNSGDILQVSVIMNTGCNGYTGTSYSQRSNYIEYSSTETFSKLYVPSDLILENDGTIKFKYEGGRVDGLYHSWELKVSNPKSKSSRYSSGSFYSNECSYENGYYYTVLDNFEEMLYSHYQNLYMANRCEIDDTLQVSFVINSCCKGYTSTGYSSYSNYIEYSPYNKIQSVTLAPSAPMLYKGHSTYLGKTIEPVDAHYGTINWLSDNEDIVTVDENGKITGVSVGTANVTAAIGDVTATVPVTVYELASNIEDEETKEEVIDTAGSIIDDIANNDEPDLSNTDIPEENIEEIKQDIQEAVENGDTFHADIKAIQETFDTYKNNWGQIQKAARDLNAQFAGAYNIEVEMYHKDKNDVEHHIGNITELDNEITFSFDLPNGNSGKSKRYVLVRIHKTSDGTIEYSPVDVTINDDGTFIAKSNKYSDFVLLYSDVDVVENDSIMQNQTHSATINDNIVLNTYIDLNEGITNPTMTAWIDDDHPVEVIGKVQNDGRYKFAFGVAAPQMTATINYTITASDENGAMVTEVNTYSIQEYGEAIIKSNSPEIKQEMKNLAAQMLNYGAYTQTYFGCNKDNLANRNLEQLGYSTALDTGAINPNAAASFKDFNGEIKAQFTTNSVIFESETALKYYMTLDEGVQNAYMAYRLKGSTDEYKYIPLTPNGNRYQATIRGIQTPELTDVYETFICTKDGDSYTQISLTKYYSPEMYATAIWNQSQSEAMKNVAVAMMMYCRSAREYFGLNEPEYNDFDVSVAKTISTAIVEEVGAEEIEMFTSNPWTYTDGMFDPDDHGYIYVDQYEIRVSSYKLAKFLQEHGLITDADNWCDKRSPVSKDGMEIAAQYTYDKSVCSAMLCKSNKNWYRYQINICYEDDTIKFTYCAVSHEGERIRTSSQSIAFNTQDPVATTLFAEKVGMGEPDYESSFGPVNIH